MRGSKTSHETTTAPLRTAAFVNAAASSRLGGPVAAAFSAIAPAYFFASATSAAIRPASASAASLNFFASCP